MQRILKNKMEKVKLKFYVDARKIYIKDAQAIKYCVNSSAFFICACKDEDELSMYTWIVYISTLQSSESVTIFILKRLHLFDANEYAHT